MSTKARKARKRAGIPFTKAQKVGTPFFQRAWFLHLVPGPDGTRHAGTYRPRSEKKIARAVADRGLTRFAKGKGAR
jgi:hypothetical protein